MSPGTSIGLSTALCVGALYFGARFRRHRMELLVAWYRNEALPAIVRNGPIVVPFLAAFLLPVLLLLLPAALGLEVGMGWPVPAQKALAFGAMGYFLLVMGSCGIALSRLPDWMVPTWLREDDGRVWFRRPAPDLFDRLTTLLSAMICLGGLALGVVAIWFVLTGHGPDGK